MAVDDLGEPSELNTLSRGVTFDGAALIEMLPPKPFERSLARSRVVVGRSDEESVPLIASPGSLEISSAKLRSKTAT